MVARNEKSMIKLVIKGANFETAVASSLKVRKILKICMAGWEAPNSQQLILCSDVLKCLRSSHSRRL